MRIIAVLLIAGLLAAFFYGVWLRTSGAERLWLPALVVGAIVLILVACVALDRYLGPVLYGEEVGDPGAE